VKKEDDWKLGISGIQPKDLKEVSSNATLTKMTGRKVKPADLADEQLQTQLRKLLFEQRESASVFFEDDDNSYYRRRRW
jgi:hypothetical protein